MRRRSVKLAIVVSVTAMSMALSACGKGGGSAAIKAQEDFANKACACKDLACVKAVQKDQADWVAKNGQEHAGVSEEDYAKMEAANKKLTDCLKKLATAGK